MARRLFFVCAGILCLALAYHLGARNATAQAGTSAHIKQVVPANDSKGEFFYVVTDADYIYAINRTTAASVDHGTGWARYRLGILR